MVNRENSQEAMSPRQTGKPLNMSVMIADIQIGTLRIQIYEQSIDIQSFSRVPQLAKKEREAKRCCCEIF
jgi:hypothetical protein